MVRRHSLPISSAPFLLCRRAPPHSCNQSFNLLLPSLMDAPQNLEVLLDVPVKVTVELGSCQMPMRDVLQLNAGSVVQLGTIADAPIDLYCNQKRIRHGQVVVVEDRLGIQITNGIG